MDRASILTHKLLGVSCPIVPSGAIVCTLGTLASGDSAAGTITNTADAVSDQQDAFLLNNHSVKVSTLVQAPERHTLYLPLIRR